MAERQVPTSNAAGKPWTIAILSEDLTLARQLDQSLEHEDFCFACARPQAVEKVPGGWATFDLVLLWVAHVRADGSKPRELLAKHPGYVVLLGRPATGKERAWRIENGADDCLNDPCDKEELLARLRASIRRRESWNEPSSILTVGSLSISLQERIVIRSWIERFPRLVMLLRGRRRFRRTRCCRRHGARRSSPGR